MTDWTEQCFSKNPISYKDFMNKYEKEMVLLECFSKDGVEIDDTVEILPDTKVLEFSIRGNSFTIVLDI